MAVLQRPERVQVVTQAAGEDHRLLGNNRDGTPMATQRNAPDTDLVDFDGRRGWCQTKQGLNYR